MHICPTGRTPRAISPFRLLTGPSLNDAPAITTDLPVRGTASGTTRNRRAAGEHALWIFPPHQRAITN